MTPSKRSVNLGPIGQIVRQQVARWRGAMSITGQELSDRIGNDVRPLGRSAISEIERGDRRVDVDDLIALAAGLRVSPAQLLMPIGQDPVPLAGFGDVPAEIYREWVEHGTPLGEARWEIATRLSQLRDEARLVAERRDGQDQQLQPLRDLAARGEGDAGELELLILNGEALRRRYSDFLVEIEQQITSLESVMGDDSRGND
jgi:transcriptional regulator with XRE-family HTH domain